MESSLWNYHFETLDVRLSRLKEMEIYDINVPFLEQKDNGIRKLGIKEEF